LVEGTVDISEAKLDARRLVAVKTLGEMCTEVKLLLYALSRPIFRCLKAVSKACCECGIMNSALIAIVESILGLD